MWFNNNFENLQSQGVAGSGAAAAEPTETVNLRYIQLLGYNSTFFLWF
jgi:hypothetical protein